MLVRDLIELLTPPDCAGCGREGDWLCANCLDAASAGAPQLCYACGKRAKLGVTCGPCRSDGAASYLVAGADFAGPVRALVHQLKFKRSQSAARTAVALVSVRLRDMPLPNVVTAVPISPDRFRERGYNQAQLVARLVARRLGLPYVETLFRTNARHQIGLGRRDRQTAIAGVFSPIRPLRGERVLVIDDVVTTGATLTEAARCLRAAGAGGVAAASIAIKRRT